MSNEDSGKLWRLAPILVAVAAGAALVLWWKGGHEPALSLRAPGTDAAPGETGGSGVNPVLAGRLIRGDGVAPTNGSGVWPGFRGPGLSGATTATVPLARSWEGGGPRVVWSVEAGEGYAGAAIRNGRVYLMDYDHEKKQDALRCLSLADGREIWRFTYPVSVKRNHGMSRTVPVVTDRWVVAIGPKCHVVCVDAISGELKWGMDMVRQFGTKVPQWYAGQCPLVDGDRLILAPAGKEALLAAVDLASGRVLWQTPNPNGWAMTHSSITPFDFNGRREYAYCASVGVVGVDAATGALLWETPDWKISIATVPSPVSLEGGRLFLSGGYNAGALMLQLKEEGGKVLPQIAYRLPAEVFGSTQHTPLLHDGLLWGTRPDGRFVCLDPAGKVVWASDKGINFGLGPYLRADDLLYVLSGDGKLVLMEANPSRFTPLAQAQVVGHESWGPLALADGRLVARDLTHLVCIDLAAK